jgi:putative chitinase
MKWLTILTKCGVKSDVAQQWAPVFNSHLALHPRAIPYFLGQVLHESANLTRLVESLNYRDPQRLRAVWQSRFPTVASALPYVGNAEKLANLVYAKRMGNTEPGDGWRYRGRGLIQVTGRANYDAVGKAIGLDLVADPDQLLKPDIALRASLAWWSINVPAHYIGDVEKITRVVNGGTNGLDERKFVTAQAIGACA